MNEGGARELAAINEGIWSGSTSEISSGFTRLSYHTVCPYLAIILAIAIINRPMHVLPGNTAGALGHARRVCVEATLAAATVCFVGVLGRVRAGVAEEFGNWTV